MDGSNVEPTTPVPERKADAGVGINWTSSPFEQTVLSESFVVIETTGFWFTKNWITQGGSGGGAQESFVYIAIYN